MNKKIIYLGVFYAMLTLSACVTSKVPIRDANITVSASYNNSQDSTNMATVQWREFFPDPNLTALIDTALVNNQELNIMLMEISVAQSEVKARKGEYLPFVNAMVGADVEKVGRYTSQGANDANTDIMPDKEFPEPLGNFQFGLVASWEIDIWKKLRNAKNASALRYLATVEGKNFMITNLVSEIAMSYYELMALDNQLEILNANIAIQQNALNIVKQQKVAAQATELAVKKFEAEVLKNQSLLYDIKQQIIETENRINFLVGRYPQSIIRNSQDFKTMMPDSIYAGLPSHLLQNRPDIVQAELGLEASKLDVKVARAAFFPSFSLTAGIGYGAFNPAQLLKTPQSLLYSLAGDLMAPLVNRNAIKANFYAANAKQMQAVYEYERSILNAYTEVYNLLSRVDNLQKSYNFKAQQVEALNQSISISTNLFKSARADYMEVLLTQRDALEANVELIETKQRQMNARIGLYKALGGGWK